MRSNRENGFGLTIPNIGVVFDFPVSGG